MFGKHWLVNESDIERRISKGFGQGSGHKYIPWIQKHDFGSKGTAKELFGNKIKRSHHLLSQLEYKIFLYFEFMQQVQDIREQFPLFDRALIDQIIRETGYKPPYYPGTKILCVLSTDFLLTVLTDIGPSLFAFSVKYSSELGKKRVQELHEIERRYWAAYQVPWQIITELDINRNTWLNLRWLRQMATLPNKLLSNELQDVFLKMFYCAISRQLSLGCILSEIANYLSITNSDAVALFKYNTWIGKIGVNYTRRISLLDPIDQLFKKQPASPLSFTV